MKVEEESVFLELPESPFLKGPGTKTAAFYNKSQKLNRDFTISFLDVVRPNLVLDGFGGSGVRGLRIAKELGLRVVISEINKKSFEYINLNCEKNGVDVELHNDSFERIADRFIFDYIDVDPYGSIIPYVDKAINNVRSGGYIGVTATDLSSLTGSVPKKTLRRYGAFIANDSTKHEMGIRLLIAYVAKRAAAFDRAAVPILSFWYSHYYRIFFRILSGSQKADEILENIGLLNKHDLISRIYADVDEGPVWTGRLNDGNIIEKLHPLASLKEKQLLENYIELVKNEDISPLFIDVTDLARAYKKDLPKMSEAMEVIQNAAGLKVGRTHFSTTGLKVSSYDFEFRRIFNH